MEVKHLAEHLRERPAQLEVLKENGVKIVGFFPGNYVPEEMIVAAGAVPVCLVSGGSPQAADAALSVAPQVICPFARTQIGERLLNKTPYYRMIDMLVAPITCQHLKKVAEIWEYQGGLEIFKLGVPHQYNSDFEVAYYAERLKVLKERLEALTGNKITNESLADAIALYNRIRTLLKEISLLRRRSPSPLSTLDFVKLNHASFHADPVFMVDVLTSIHEELKDAQPAAIDRDAPRLLLVGPNIGEGDYSLLELTAASGGDIVVEEVCEGVRYYRHAIETGDDSIDSLARGYLEQKIPCAFMRHSAQKRLDFILGLIKDFNVSGVIWYELMCCETYDAEAYFFARMLREQRIPMLLLESDYGTSNIGQLKTRIEAFIEILKGVTTP